MVGTGGGRAVSTVVTDHPERARYELEVDGGRVGLVTYRMRHGVVELLHTEVDPDHQGEGLAAVLVRAALDDARARGLQVLPFCPYVARYVDGHRDEYLDLVPEARRAEFGLDG